MQNTKLGRLMIFAFTGLFIAGCQTMMSNMGMIPMGSSQDVADANALWEELASEDLVGFGAKQVKFYPGTPPHGEVLETLHKEVTVDGHTGMAIVKRNYRGSKDPKVVKKDPRQYLAGVTVMFKREAGYDPDNENWFWAKYKPDGTLHVKEKMMMEIPLAGRVAKGKPQGCIACHQAAPGGDYVFDPELEI